MTGSHDFGDYVGRHRKPEASVDVSPTDPITKEGPITDVLRATYALFTHPPQLRPRNKEEK